LHLAGRYLNQYLDTARAFVNWCCAHEPPWLPGTPLAKVERADETVKRREKRALALDELDRLRKASGSLCVVYLTATLTGLRRSELKRLHGGDVHLEEDPPHIQLRAAATKAKHADVVSVNPELLEALRAIRPPAPAADAPVFATLPRNATFRRDVV
jgi:integrase